MLKIDTACAQVGCTLCHCVPEKSLPCCAERWAFSWAPSQEPAVLQAETQQGSAAVLGLEVLQIRLTEQQLCDLDTPMLSAMWKVGGSLATLILISTRPMLSAIQEVGRGSGW